MWSDWVKEIITESWNSTIGDGIAAERTIFEADRPNRPMSCMYDTTNDKEMCSLWL